MATKSKDNLYLLKFRKDVHSQNGEDGVLVKIFSLLPKRKGHWGVEFGAWDGIVASNTSNLIRHKGWHGVYIEADSERFKELIRNYGDNPRVYCMQKFIEIKGVNTLDNLLKGLSEVPEDFDLLSIDIDSCDYHVWKSIKRYAPRVVIIEFNPSIPLDYNYVQPPDFSIHDESNLGILVELGKAKGYELISCVENNAIFVKKEFYRLFGLTDNRPEVLFGPFLKKWQTHLWQGYDGTLHIVGCDRLVVHNIRIRESKIQVLPKFMRIFPGKTNPLLQLFKKYYYKYPLISKTMHFFITGIVDPPIKVQ